MFKNRAQAGKLLAARLVPLKGGFSLVLGIPRGGVVVAKEVAKVLKLPLSALPVKKVSVVGQPELAVGAMAPEGIFEGRADIASGRLLEKYIVKFGLPQKLKGKGIILVDDGVATGATIKAAIGYLKMKGAGEIILAAPVAPADVLSEIVPLVEKTVILETPANFSAVGQFYLDFPQVDDREVVQLLDK